MVLDTSVLSELTRPAPEPKVMAWLEAQPIDELFTTAIARAELLYGARILPAGRLRERLLTEVQGIFSTDMVGRVLPYDEAAANAPFEIAVRRRVLGGASSQSDLMITCIVRSHGAALATRNIRGFEDSGIVVIDSWH